MSSGHAESNGNLERLNDERQNNDKIRMTNSEEYLRFPDRYVRWKHITFVGILNSHLFLRAAG